MFSMADIPPKPKPRNVPWKFRGKSSGMSGNSTVIWEYTSPVTGKHYTKAIHDYGGIDLEIAPSALYAERALFLENKGARLKEVSRPD